MKNSLVIFAVVAILMTPLALGEFQQIDLSIFGMD